MWGRKGKDGKAKVKRSLPNDVAPIIVMPITHYDDYDWESNDTCYNLENLFGTNLENRDDNNCYTIGAIHIINDENDYACNMQRPKLGDAMFDENDVFCPQSFDEQIYYDDSMPPIYDDCNIYESGFGRVSTLGSSGPTILEGVQSYFNDKSGFWEVMTLFSDESTISEEISIDYEKKLLSMMIIVMTCML